MNIKNLLRSTVFILIIVFTIGSLTAMALAKNGPGKGGMSGGGMKLGNQVQVREPKKNQNQVQEPVNTPIQLQERKKIQTQLQECKEECNQNCEENCNGECTCNGDGVLFQINADQYKDMTIADIAGLWDISANNLLAKLIDAFNLEEDDYNPNNTTLEDLRFSAEDRFPASAIRDIIKDLIQTS